MKKNSLFKIVDESTNETFDGLNQEWFKTKWNRMSGCGPTIATQLILVLLGRTQLELIQAKDAMELVRKFVKPTFGGIYNTKLLVDGMYKYLDNQNLQANIVAMDVLIEQRSAIQWSSIVEFIQSGLQQQVPVAFLNLSNGNQKQLESWHWTLITNMETSKQATTVTILDNTKWLEIDLYQWYQSTTKNGGFVYLANDTKK